MNITTLRQRIVKLEVLSTSGAAPQPLHPLAKLLDVLVAYYLGAMGGNDSIASGMARGLGYATPGGLKVALAADQGTPAFDDLNARWRDAMGRLFALKDATPNCEGEDFAAVVGALTDELPEHYRAHPFLDGLLTEAHSPNGP